jgi:hypothetical protein
MPLGMLPSELMSSGFKGTLWLVADHSSLIPHDMAYWAADNKKTALITST